MKKLFICLMVLFFCSCAVPLQMVLSKSKTITMERFDDVYRVPVEYSEVKFFNSKSQVKKDFVNVAYLYSHWTGYASSGKIIKSMKVEAGKIGANGVIWDKKADRVTAIFINY